MSLRKFAPSESESFIGANVKMSTELTEYQRLIKSALEDVKGIETFATGGRITDAPLPGLSVKGVGPIRLPFSGSRSAPHRPSRSSRA